MNLRLLSSITGVITLTACGGSPLPLRASSRGPIALDHILISVRPGAPERAALERAGFTIAPTVNRHESQGTASITVEFLNGFLELIWADSTVPVSPRLQFVMDRYRRRAEWRTSGLSPFGIALHRTGAATDSLPFPTRAVRTDWMEPGTVMLLMSGPTDTVAPSISIHPHAVDEAGNLEALRTRKPAASVFIHPNGTLRLTSADRMIVPTASGFSSATRLLDSLGIVHFERGPEWLLEVTLDNGRQSKTSDLRPDLPLVVKY